MKTGIMYDEDMRMKQKGAVIVDIHALADVVTYYASLNESEILMSFAEHIQDKLRKREEVEEKLRNKQYADALRKPYGQFVFLDRIFSERSRGKRIGTESAENKRNQDVFIDYIYAGTNQDGRVYTKYCFWGKQYSKKLRKDQKNEFHYLFWRIDAKGSYIALRHYDENARSENNEMNERKKAAYRVFYKSSEEAANEDKEISNFYNKKVGQIENAKESNLVYIPIEKIKDWEFERIRNMMIRITGLFDGMYEEIDKKIEDQIKKQMQEKEREK